VTSERKCPHYNGDLSRYEDPVAVKEIQRLQAEVEAAQIKIATMKNCSFCKFHFVNYVGRCGGCKNHSKWEFGQED